MMLHIIIPTLNAARTLPRLMESLGPLDADYSVIVSDGGSSDDTLSVGIKAGARLAIGASGRGQQLCLGVHLAALTGETSDWYLFLHADCRLPPTWRRDVATAMREGVPRYFRFRSDATGLRARILDGLVNFRSVGWGLPYGDQGLLISRAEYDRVGGFEPISLFEDVDLVQRLSGLQPMPSALRTDIGAYLDQGLWQRGVRNLKLLKRFRNGDDIADLLRDYKQDGTRHEA